MSVFHVPSVRAGADARATHTLESESQSEAQARVIEGVPDGDVQEVDEAGVHVQAHDLHGVVFVQALLHQFVHGEAHADQKAIGRAFAHRFERLQGEPGAVGEASP